MNWLSKIIDKLFLIKEIKSKSGELHFKRYCLLKTPWFAFYLHHIMKSDDDKHFHDHPFAFTSVILRGAYSEQVSYSPLFDRTENNEYYAGDVIERLPLDAHKITLLSKDVWTLVYVKDFQSDWGYRLKENTWVDHKTYRELKKMMSEKSHNDVN